MNSNITKSGAKGRAKTPAIKLPKLHPTQILQEQQLARLIQAYNEHLPGERWAAMVEVLQDEEAEDFPKTLFASTITQYTKALIGSLRGHAARAWAKLLFSEAIEGRAPEFWIYGLRNTALKYEPSNAGEVSQMAANVEALRAFFPVMDVPDISRSVGDSFVAYANSILGLALKPPRQEGGSK